MDEEFVSTQEVRLLGRLYRLRRLSDMEAPQVIIDRERALVRRALRALGYDMPLEEPEEMHRLALLPLSHEEEAVLHAQIVLWNAEEGTMP